MDLLDLPLELLLYMMQFTGPDALHALCLTEKRILHNIARDLLSRNVTVIFGINQKPKPNLFSFDSGRLAAIRSLSVVVNRYCNVCLSSFSSVLAGLININHVCVSGGSGPLIRFILENTMLPLVTLELDCCDAEPQDFADMVPITIRKLCISRCHSSMRFMLGPLTVEDLEVHGPDIDGDCMSIGVTLRRLTEAHLRQMKRLCLVYTCRDAGCRDAVHLASALERPFSSLEELVLDIPLSQDTHQKFLQLIPTFPMLKESCIVSRVNETSLSMFLISFIEFV
ncbi:hypothetical protein EV421DRAFT_169886 [Armillaria borealis]|uniref:F-box domain-containing protein n=1 Tax=Armillaria borealis TaxID=47425 RepID=A0AA39MF48_9AGAR|nr:hypothetical protein EV421DRAFT_169886 [Armillaria borealis]